MTYISTLPTPPSRSDAPATFSDKADALLGALPTFVTEANTLSDEVDAMRDDAEAKRAATSTLHDQCVAIQTTCAGHESTTSTFKTQAGSYRTEAKAYRDSALTAAAAAGAAAGLPTLVGNARKQLSVNDAEDGVEWGNAIFRAPIFSAAAAGYIPVTSGEVVTDGMLHYVGAYNIDGVAATASTFVAWATGSGVVSVSSDGKTWSAVSTGLGSSLCRVGAGQDGLVVAVQLGAEACAISTDHGQTWAAGGALPASAWYAGTAPACIGNYVLSTTGLGVARSEDGGATWALASMPEDAVVSVHVAGGLFVAPSKSTTYHTSPDGETWTARTAPHGGAMTQRGTVIVNGGWYTEDGVAWAQLPERLTVTAAAAKINGVWWGGSVAGMSSYHAGGARAIRALDVALLSEIGQNSTATVVVARDGYVWTIPSDGGDAMAFFTTEA